MPLDGVGWELGVMAASGEVDALVETLQELVADVGAREKVTIQVCGWSRPDLEALEWAPLSGTDEVFLLWGVLPERVMRPPGGESRRSHADADETLLGRAKCVAAALERRPELVREAHDEVTKRLSTVPVQESKTLTEWLEVLDTMTNPRLRKWLVSRSERAKRLRQSMPFVLLQAGEDQSSATSSRAPHQPAPAAGK